MYANIASNDDDKSLIKIFVGGAVGPYGPHCRSRGLEDQIRSHKKHIKGKTGVTGLQYRTLRMANWHANWTVLVSFSTLVKRGIMILAQTVITIFFGSCPRQPYIMCRPKTLRPFPINWGLNEISPLYRSFLATYNKLSEAVDPEEARLIRERLLSNSLARASTKAKQQQDQLRTGDPIHVNVVQCEGCVKHLYITPMTALL